MRFRGEACETKRVFSLSSSLDDLIFLRDAAGIDLILEVTRTGGGLSSEDETEPEVDELSDRGMAPVGRGAVVVAGGESSHASDRLVVCTLRLP